jgi:DNA-binding NarL/FixJ family response regulator
MVRAGTRLLLESHPGLAVVGEASEGAEALALATREQPDVVLLDLDSGGETALDLIPELLTVAPDARVLTLMGAQDPELPRKAVCLGAVGLVPKDKPAEVLFQAIEKVHAG